MMKNQAHFLLAAALLAFGGTAAPALAQFEGRSADDVVQVSLVEGWRMENGHHMAAIRISLAPGWRTYWRAPGEGGIPPQLRLTGDDGISGMLIHWPRPEVFFANGIRSIGYRDDVILPIEFAMSDAGPVALNGRLEIGVCQEVCMPVTLDLDGLLPASVVHDPAVSAALADRPLTALEAGAGHATCAVEPISDGLRVTVTAMVPPVGNDETLVLEHANPGIWVSGSVTTRSGNTVTGVADLVPPDAGPFGLDRGDLRITVIGSRMAVELDGCTG